MVMLLAGSRCHVDVPHQCKYTNHGVGLETRQLYEGLLDLPAAMPLHYYYNYEQTPATAIDPLYMSTVVPVSPAPEGWTLPMVCGISKKNTQLHVISGSSLGENQQRHVCFDHDCLEQVLMRVELRGLKHKIVVKKPLNFF